MATEKQDKSQNAESLPQDPEVLAASIEQTRDDLAHTLDEIADKVSPKRVTKRTTKKIADTAKAKAETTKVIVADKAADAKDALLDAKETLTDKAAELRHHDEASDDLTGIREPVAPGPVLTGGGPTADEQPLRSTTSDPYAAPEPGVPKEYLAAAGGAGLLVVLLLALRRRRTHRRRAHRRR